MATTYGKWRLKLPPKEFAASLLNPEDVYLDGGCEAYVEAEYIVSTYVEEAYLDVETAHEILRYVRELLEEP